MSEGRKEEAEVMDRSNKRWTLNPKEVTVRGRHKTKSWNVEAQAPKSYVNLLSVFWKSIKEHFKK